MIQNPLIASIFNTLNPNGEPTTGNPDQDAQIDQMAAQEDQQIQQQTAMDIQNNMGDLRTKFYVERRQQRYNMIQQKRLAYQEMTLGA
jgi:hypothetical protein